MASNAKQIVAYEHTENGLEPMNEARYRAFLQEGIDSLKRGEGINDADANDFFEGLAAARPS